MIMNYQRHNFSPKDVISLILVELHYEFVREKIKGGNPLVYLPKKTDI